MPKVVAFHVRFKFDVRIREKSFAFNKYMWLWRIRNFFVICLLGVNFSDLKLIA